MGISVNIYDLGSHRWNHADKNVFISLVFSWPLNGTGNPFGLIFVYFIAFNLTLKEKQKRVVFIDISTRSPFTIQFAL
jgi:hypothetical protein